MGKRNRRRAREAGKSGRAAPVATTNYKDSEGNTLTLRNELTAGTRRQLEALEAKPAATAEDQWQRRIELLFERLAVRWEIAGLPIESQKELLGRFRMASAEERKWVREVLDEHLGTHYPELRR